MKKVLSILALMGVVSAGYSQGLVIFQTISASYAVSTNNNGTIGKISSSSAAPFGYYFALLYSTAGSAPSATTKTSLGNWTYGATGTNYVSAGSINGGNSLSLPVTAGSTVYVELVGWSASLGTTWSAVSTQISNGFTSNGYFGVSNVGSVTTGGAGTPAGPALALFGGTGITSGFQLNYVATPEPSTIALAAMGGLSLLALRRKKA
jgi:hypothetical protein